MLPALASVDELSTWIGQPILGGSIGRASAILSAASTLVRRHAGETWVDAEGELDPGDDPVLWEAAKQVVVVVAARVYLNPEGEKQAQLGPHSRTVEDWAALGLALRDEEKEMLSPVSGALGLGILAVSRGDVETGRVTSWYDQDDALLPEWFQSRWT